MDRASYNETLNLNDTGYCAPPAIFPLIMMMDQSCFPLCQFLSTVPPPCTCAYMQLRIHAPVCLNCVLVQVQPNGNRRGGQPVRILDPNWVPKLLGVWKGGGGG